MIGLDFETYCDIDIRKHGLDRYVSHPSFRVLLASTFRPHDGARRFDFVFNPHARELLSLYLQDKEIAAHNLPFELAVLERIGMSRVIRQGYDSAIIARARGAASKLEAAAPQLLGVDKMEAGAHLIRLFSMPQKDGTVHVLDPIGWTSELLAQWKTFGDYCDLDAELSHDIVFQYLRHLDGNEIRNAGITQRMNERGWCVDLDLVREMQRVYQENLVTLEHDFRAEHDPKAELNFRSTMQLRKWCADHKVRATSFDELHVTKLLARVRKEIERISNGGTPKRGGPDIFDLEAVEAMLVTKQELGGSSLSKLQTIVDMTGTDGRLRGQYLHAGAGQTMRTSGRGVQMQNLKRLGPVPDDVEELFAADRHFDSLWDNGKLARNLRQVFEAEVTPGRLIVADFSAVESRALAYLAGEDWKVQSYRDGKDMYKVLAASMLGTEYDAVTKAERQQGKVGELSCGYGAGPGAVVTFAEKMGMDIDEEQATEIVFNWRETNPKIVQLWKNLDAALHEVVERRDTESWVHLDNGNLKVGIVRVANYESVLAEYPGSMNIELRVVQGSNTMLTRIFVGAHTRGNDICYLKPSELKSGNLWRARWTKNGQSGPYKIYGGKLTGILTQSFCRELFFDALEEVERELQLFPNVKLIGQFHDEAVVEWWPHKSAGLTFAETTQRIEKAMTGNARFPDFPLVVDVKAGHRYIK
jgi:DNA polymerase